MLQTVINNLKHTVFNLFVLLLAGIIHFLKLLVDDSRLGDEQILGM